VAELIVTLKGRELKRVAVTRTDMAIGRDPIAEVKIDNIGVSRVHAVVRYRDGVFRVHDHDSANGISVNGNLRTVHNLRDGDEILVGKFIVRFSANTGPEMPMEDNSGRTDLDAIKQLSLADKTTALGAIDLAKLGLTPRDEREDRVPDFDDDETGPRHPHNRETLLLAGLFVAVVIIVILAIALITR
jgi:pSer/pThr/pTyr-binding forkhead associated (FHA) protein